MGLAGAVGHADHEQLLDGSTLVLLTDGAVDRPDEPPETVLARLVGVPGRLRLRAAGDVVGLLGERSIALWSDDATVPVARPAERSEGRF